MKRFFLIIGLALMLVPRLARADGADDQYIRIYNLIQQGDTLSAEQPDQALIKYREALAALQRFQKGYPDWNNKVVNYRLNYLATQITAVSGKTPPTAPPPAVPINVSNPITPPVQRIASPANGIENQLNALRSELQQLQSDKLNLEAKLKEALAAQPASVDPAELARANQRIDLLLKDNDALKAGLAQAQSNTASAASSPGSKVWEQMKRDLADVKRQLAEQTARADKLATDNQSLQAQVKTLSANSEAVAALRAENEMLKKAAAEKSSAVATAGGKSADRQLAEAQAQIAALQSEKDILRVEKEALQNRVKELAAGSVTSTVATPVWTEDSTRVKQLERERDELQKKLDAAQKQLYGRKNTKAIAARMDELTGELNMLRARIEVYDARRVPYSTEELALFKKPEPVMAVTDPNAGKKSVRELPPGAVALVAEAQRDFAAKKFDQAEEKYLEVLRRDNRNVNTLANLATIQLEMGHFDEAGKHIREALALDPDDAYSLSILGNLKYREGKYDDALDALSRAAKIDPQNAEIQNYLGLALSQKGLRGPAETALRKAIQLQPDYGSAHNNLAVIYATQKPPLMELARWHYQRALASGFPHNPDLEKLLGETKTAETNQ